MEVRNVMGAYYVRKKTNLIEIHKVIAWGLEPEKKEGEEYTPIYPCPVINRFECPYEKDVNKPFCNTGNCLSRYTWLFLKRMQ